MIKGPLQPTYRIQATKLSGAVLLLVFAGGTTVSCENESKAPTSRDTESAADQIALVSGPRSCMGGKHGHGRRPGCGGIGGQGAGAWGGSAAGQGGEAAAGGQGGGVTAVPCSSVTVVPATPALAGPSRGAYTGSALAPAGAMTLQPTFAWHAVPVLCTQQTFQIQIDDSCAPGQFDTCSFPSPEVDVATVSSALTTFTPAPLPISAVAPVGARYAWRVRACAGAGNCGAWSETWNVNVGRVREDINGDGFGDLLAGSSNPLNLVGSRLEVYPGSFDLTASAPAYSIGSNCISAVFLGDVDADGFGDVACKRLDLIPTQRTVPVVLFGGTDLSAPRTVTLASEQASASSIMGISSAGDLNGDGFADIDIEWVNVAGTGVVPVHLHFGSAAFTDGPPDLSFLGPAPPQGALLSFDVSRTAADLNGDGYDDLVLFHSDITGRVLQIYLGGHSPEGTPDASLALGPAADFVPWAAGDVQGDGYADVLVGDTGSGLGAYLGSSTLSSSITPIPESGNLVFAGFDLDGDRRGDFLVRTSTGSVVDLGGATFTSVGGGLSHLVGTSFASSDYNGDGRADFASAAPSADGVAPGSLIRVVNDGTLDPPGAALVGGSDGYKLKGFVVP